jgi:hypothetical protein
VELLGGGESGSGLGGAVLGMAEFGDGFGERGELEDEDGGGGIGAVAAEAGVDGHEPSGAAEPLPAGVGAGMRPKGSRAARS